MSNPFQIRVLTPGDGTRYRVAWAHLDEAASEANGHGGPAMFFAFGLGGRRLVGFTFNTDAGHYLAFSYFREKMEAQDAQLIGWTLVAAYQVALHLLGRPGDDGQRGEFPEGYPTLAALGWRPDWRAQLEEEVANV